MTEIGTNEVIVELGELIEQYKELKLTEIDEEGIERADQMIEACELLNRKSLEEVFNLIDTGVFNTIITAYCKKAMRLGGVEEETAKEVLSALEDLYEEAAEEVLLEEMDLEREE